MGELQLVLHRAVPVDTGDVTDDRKPTRRMWQRIHWQRAEGTGAFITRGGRSWIRK